jgi:hypothetical protein
MFDPFEGLFGGPSQKPKPEKGVPLHAKEIEGVVYIRADDVAALLEINGILPGVAAKLRQRVQA